jgi:flagellar motor switch protein FliG
MRYKKITLITIITCLTFSGNFLFSEGKGKSENKPGHKGPGGDPIMRLINMPDKELDKLEEAIKKIRSMSPEEKEALKEKMKKFNNMPPEKKDQMRENMKKFKEVRSKMSEEESEAFRNEIQGLSPEERQEKIKSLIEQYSN